MNKNSKRNQNAQFLNETKLQNLITLLPKLTHKKGSHCINFILIRRNVTEVTKEKVYFPLNDGPLMLDHRACYGDVKSDAIFKQKYH